MGLRPPRPTRQKYGMKARTLYAWAAIIATWILLSFLPVIVIERAPSAPPGAMVFEVARASVQDIVGVGHIHSGAVYAVRWYSVVSLLLLVAVAVMAAIVLKRLISPPRPR